MKLIPQAAILAGMLGALLADNWQQKASPRSASFHVQDRDGVPYRVTLIGGGRDAVASYFDGARAFVIVEDLNRPLRLGPEILRVIYGLSPAEGKLLLALAEGLTLAQISTRRGVSRETTRSQLKAACAKLGVSRQADAVRMICRLGYSFVAPAVFDETLV